MAISCILPIEILELIIFEFSPDIMRCFLSTEISNFFRQHIRKIVVPNYEQRYYINTSTICGMGYVYLACNHYRFPKKKRKSQKYLKFYKEFFSYKDFPKLHKILVNDFLGLSKYDFCYKQ